MDLFKSINNHLIDLKILYVETFAPFYTASIGGHLFNLMNREKPIYFRHGNPVDTRNHIMFVAPTGGGKSLYTKQFLRGASSVLYNSGIDTIFQMIITEAGFIGTNWRAEEGKMGMIQGDALEFKNAIFGCEEFDAIVKMAKSSHSSNIDNALLSALDEGFIYKRLGAGRIEYQTNITMIVCTQTKRFDLSSGMGRRLVFLLFIPTSEDLALLDDANWEGENIRWNPKFLKPIRKGIKRRMAQIKNLKKITYDPAIRKFLQKKRVIHYETEIYKKISIGYTCMRTELTDPVLEIVLDNELKRMFENEFKWRKAVKIGADYMEVLEIIDGEGGKMKVKDLLYRLTDFGTQWAEGSRLIIEMNRNKSIHYNAKSGIVTRKKHQVGVASSSGKKQ